MLAKMGRAKKNDKRLSRKERRKKERLAKKARKQMYFMQRSSKKRDLFQHANGSSEVGSQEKEISSTKETLKQTKKQQGKSKLKKRNRKTQIIGENKKEDRLIKSLEKKMGMNLKRRKHKLPQSFVSDGLDFILEVVDKPEGAALSVDEEEDVKDTESGEENVMVDSPECIERCESVVGSLKTHKKVMFKLSEEHEEESDEENRSSDDAEEGWGNVDEDDDDDTNKKGVDLYIEQDDVDINDESEQEELEDNEMIQDADDEVEDGDDGPKSPLSHSDKVQEVMKVDQEHREKIWKSASSSSTSGLKRRIKGLLNRLSESNLQVICNQLEELYMTNTRNDMNETLTALLMESATCSTPMPERILMEQAMVLAVLHANVGNEVGAYFLQTLATKFDSMMKSALSHANPVEKERSNAVLFLSYMYAFKIVHSLLIFDILHRIIDGLCSESEVDLIVNVLKTVGFNLRKDDSVSLREVIIKLQSKVASVSELCDQSRVKFLLDIVRSIQNNNAHKIPNYDSSTLAHAQKIVRTFIHKGHYIQELRISLADLLNADQKGRWWIVGSAWSSSDTLLHKEKATVSNPDSNPTEESFSEKVLELARKQRMNSDVRKTIFCIIMSAEDFLDCFEKLVRLGVHHHRDVVHVTLDCCLQEKIFNPYYAHLLYKLCQFDRHYQMALKFALWDKFKIIGQMKARQTSSLSQMLVHLFLTDSLCISILKAFHFSEMDKHLVSFLRQLFTHLLLDSSQESCCSVFRRIAAPTPKLHLMREGLKLFFRHFLLRGDNLKVEDRKELLTERVKMIEEVLTVSEKSVF